MDNFSIVLVLLFIQKYNSPPISSSSDDKHLDIAVFNVNAFSGQQEELELFLGTLDVDLLVMIEKRAEEIVGMQRIRDDFQEKDPKYRITMPYSVRKVSHVRLGFPMKSVLQICLCHIY